MKTKSATGNETKKKIDIRIMKLNKWYVPKSISLTDVSAGTVVLGYFDSFEINVVSDENIASMRHPFTVGHSELASSKKTQKRNLVDYSSQEQLLFLNLCEEGEEDGICFTEKSVKTFWDNKSTVSPYFFLSMIHISHCGMLEKALKKIKDSFDKDYLSYISYDYCDIVLFAKNMKIPQFMDKIRMLFGIVPEADTDGTIFDTFSMVSFYPLQSAKPFDEGLLAELPQEGETELFQATINLSIRDHNEFNKWYSNEIEKQGLEIRRYHLFGRYDVSLTKEKADTQWLMDMMFKLHEKQNQKMFWTFETFIKVEASQGNTEVSAGYEHLEERYKKVESMLRTKIVGLEEAVQKTQIENKERYLLPVYEVRDGICSIIKNGFAEEFVCCAYESFLHFISYMTENITLCNNGLPEGARKEIEIAECYDKYFAALDTLVNSMMHNERQFVQATAFNAVFYSVPPKIMAFYNAYIYRIKQILMDERCDRKYTFLIYPSFSPTITLEQISLEDKPPCDRLLTVAINEKTLYDIQSVIYQMVHELAHYVGNDLRCREGIRKQKIEHTLLKWIINECNMGYDAYEILQMYFLRDPITGKGTAKDPEGSKNYYLQYLYKQGVDFLQKIDRAQGMTEIVEKYYQEKTNGDFRDESLEVIGIKGDGKKAYVNHYPKPYAYMKRREMQQKVKKMEDPKAQNNYRLYISLITSVYRECYADLQMILVLAMNAEDYLNTFLIHHNIPVGQLLNQYQDIIRIGTICRVMMDCGLWNEPAENDNAQYKFIYGLLRDYNRRIEANTEEARINAAKQKVADISEAAGNFTLEGGIRFKEKLPAESVSEIIGDLGRFDKEALFDISIDLYEYLLEVMEKSIHEYSKKNKAKKIKDVRILVNEILEFKDTVKVFCCVEGELVCYKREGCAIN